MHVGARVGLASFAVIGGVFAVHAMLTARRPLPPTVAEHVEPVRAAAPVEPVRPPSPAPPVQPPSRFGRCGTLDFNADGIPDRIEAVHDSCGTGGCVYDVFLGPGTDGDRHAGTIEGHCPIEIVPREGGMPDVFVRWRLGAVDESITRYRFDGHRMRALDYQECTRGDCRPAPMPR